jgi:hypothetical protein
MTYCRPARRRARQVEPGDEADVDDRLRVVRDHLLVPRIDINVIELAGCPDVVHVAVHDRGFERLLGDVPNHEREVGEAVSPEELQQRQDGQTGDLTISPQIQGKGSCMASMVASLRSQMIDEVIGPGLVNPRNTCYVNAFVQLFFHIRPLRLVIVAWPNRDPISSALRLIFVAMTHNRPIDAVSLSTVCEPYVLDGKDCFELALQTLGALRDASLGCLDTHLNNCSVSDRSLGFLPPSHPDLCPIDLHSSYAFPFLDPLL